MVLDGHSFVFGVNASRIGTTDFASRLKHSFDPAIFSYASIGHSGFRTGGPAQDPTACLYPLAPTEVDPLIKPGMLNILLYMEMINSITHYQAGSPPAAQVTANVIADMTAFYQARRDAGWKNGNLIGGWCMVPEAPWPVQYQQCAVDVSAWHRGTAISSGLIDFVVDPTVDSEYATGIAAQPDGIHPNDYLMQVLADYGYAAVLQQYAAHTGSTAAWDPMLIGRIAFRYEAARPWLIYNGDTRKVSSWADRSTWGYDLSAAGGLQPTWNAAGPSVDGSGSTMVTGINVDLTYTKKLEVFAVIKDASTSGIICEFGNNYTSLADAFAVQTDASGKIQIAEVGAVGVSSATADAIAGTKHVTWGLDNTASTNQGNIIVDGAAAPGLVRVDAPNANAFGTHPLSVLGRAGGTLTSTMSIGVLIAFAGAAVPLSPAQRAQLISWAVQWG